MTSSAISTILKEKKSTFFALGLLVMINMGLCLALISWGLPYYLHADEQFVMTNSMRTAENKLIPVNFIYPPGWFYAHSSLYVGYLGFLFATGQVGGISDFIDFYHANPSNFLMISRGLSVLASGLILLLTFVFTKKMSGDSKAGLLAVLFIVISPGFLGSSTIIKAEIVIALLLLISLYLLFFKNEKDRTTWLSLLTALAMSANYYGAFLLPVVIFALWFLKKRQSIIPYIAKIAIFGFLINFTLLFDINQSIEDITFLADMTKDREGTLCIPFWEGNQLTSIFNYLGAAPLLLAAIGFVWLWREKKEGFNLLGLSVLIFIIGLFLVSGRTPRYSVVVYPLVTIMAGIVAMRIYRGLGEKYKSALPKIGFAAVLLLLMIPTALLTFNFAANEDTRLTSARWIKENISEDSIIAMETYGPTLYAPKYYTFSYNGKDPATGKGFFIMKDYYITDLNLETADYIILSSLASEKTKYLCNKEPLETYKAIRNCPLVNSWNTTPSTFWFHNPTIELYKNCLNQK